MPGMSLIEGDALREAEAEAFAPWPMPGMDEESLEEPHAARVSARAAAVPAAATARRGRAEREEANMREGLSGWAHHAGGAREGQDTGPVRSVTGFGAVPVTSARRTPE
ncbi:hypothetical protein GCM10018966_018940 [Streptomyces yanii]